MVVLWEGLSVVVVKLQFMVEELTKYGEDMNCVDECVQVLQDR